MESQLPTPRPSTEQAPAQYIQGEQSQTYGGVELGNQQNVERREQRIDPNEAAAAVSAIVLPTPVMANPTPVVDDSQTVASDDAPMSAADEDLIEKEWVDKAKRIISSTHDDPHRREEEISQLQADYLRKRYGKELGT